MKTLSQRAAWAVKNLENSEDKLAEGTASIEYVAKADQIKNDAVADAHYDSREAAVYRKSLNK